LVPERETGFNAMSVLNQFKRPFSKPSAEDASKLEFRKAEPWPVWLRVSVLVGNNLGVDGIGRLGVLLA
jgi:hypothetical protein